MNYELAKQLKDAGFPQKEHNAIFKTASLGFSTDVNGPNTTFYSPTLPELIEACGNDFDSLRVNKFFTNSKKFIAYFEALNSNQPEPIKARGMNGFDGDTPEEAVAKLWLELNKK